MLHQPNEFWILLIILAFCAGALVGVVAICIVTIRRDNRDRKSIQDIRNNHRADPPSASEGIWNEDYRFNFFK